MTPDRVEPAVRERAEWRREAASWSISLLLHLGIVALLASLVWIVPDADEVPVTLILADEAGTDVAPVGDAGSGAGGGAPGRPDPRADARADALAAAPAPAPLPAELADLLVPTADAAPSVTAEESAAQDPAFAILAELADEAAATQPIGAGADPMLAGTSPGFRALAGGLGESGLDVVVVLDATESMAPTIGAAKRRLGDVVGVVAGIIGAARGDDPDLRFGAVAFKDYGDEYGLAAVRALPLTEDRAAMQAFLDDVIASGGGDLPEPLDKALAAATDERMGWLRRRRSVIVLVGDAPCHPGGRADLLRSVSRFVDRHDAVVSVIDVSPGRGTPQRDLADVARAGGGSAFLLEDESRFWRSLVVSIFGERFERDVEAIVERWTTRDEP